jgi:hypothetical protein
MVENVVTGNSKYQQVPCIFHRLPEVVTENATLNNSQKRAKGAKGDKRRHATHANLGAGEDGGAGVEEYSG